MFQTLNRLDSSGNRTSEEFHYQFDSGGRLRACAFMQTPAGGQNDYSSVVASLRMRSMYEYLPDGQLVSVSTFWDEDGDEAEKVYRARYEYDDYKKVRTDAYFDDLGSGNSWQNYRHDVYGYDELDQLTSENWGGTSSNWSYDAAGNRTNTGYSHDDLNRMLTSPGMVYEYDVLGNRTWRNRTVNDGTAQRNTWDLTNRLTSSCSTAAGASYQYRADGMRVKKVEGLNLAWHVEDVETGSGYFDVYTQVNRPTTRYWYDGQMVVWSAPRK